MKILRFENITKIFNSRSSLKALDNITLEIESGDFVNIIGRSGSGKSTLLKISAGILTPTSGEIELDGENLANKSDSELSRIRNYKIGFIPQGASVLPNLTIIENVILPAILWEHGGDITGYAMILLEKFGIANLANSYPSEVSGGELRRALIARALINHPKIILADEPTSNLDSESSQNILQIFSRLNSQENVTLLLVSHDLDTLKFGKRVFEMNDGILTQKSVL